MKAGLNALNWLASVIALALSLLLHAHPALSGQRCIVDDMGAQICLERPARRIIALYGAYNEIITDLGIEDRLIARTKADTSPKSILSKPCIGTHMRPNVEMVLGLRPDLVIQGAGRKDAMIAVNQIARHGIPVAIFNPRSFEEMFSVIERIGMLTGKSREAKELVISLRQRLNRVAKRINGRSRPWIFFEVRHPNLLGAGGDSIVESIIQWAGGQNCFGSVEKKLVRVDMEALIQCNPDFYLVQKGPMNKNPVPPQKRPNFQILKAVKKNNILYVDEKMFSRPTPRTVTAVEELSRWLHPQPEDISK